MSLAVTGILLLSAVIHASWNALLKSSGDRVATMAVLFGTMGLIAATGLPYVPPMTKEGWLWLAPAVLLHGMYGMLLIRMYAHGDLSLAYPIARGVAPLAVLSLAVLLAGEIPTGNQMIGVAIVGVGLLGFMGRNANASAKAVIYALMTGLLIASYTVIDGMGVRATGSALTFSAWLFTAWGMVMVLIAASVRGKALAGLVGQQWRRAVPAGAAAGLAYTGVMWGLGQANMGGVSAIRESSVIFAALIGTMFLGEPMGKRRIGASLIVCLGIVVLSLPL
ncbi:DMT family transporter [Aestuariispira ectoiniformans]|uniref:DMT family transporter n=1 Tax=Aestuariispira ectoiniformans TaxID=2775080 RepID=UPI00223C22D0|nr:DMT family transporter [Aestuariispira ectoiniformans]